MANNILGLVDYVNQQGEAGRARGMENKFRTLTGAAMAGDQNAFAQQVQLNPAAAVQVQAAGDITAKKVRGAAKYMKEALDRNNPLEIEGRYRAVRPMLAQAGQSQGKVPPEMWTPDMLPMIEQVLAQTAYLDQANNSEIPTGYRQFEMTAAAAGLKQGSPEYQQAANIALGREGRASTGGYGFREIEGMDGRKRMGRTNPRTGATEVYDERSGDFVPMGGAGGMGATPQPGAPMDAGGQPAAALQSTTFTGADGVPVYVDPAFPPNVQASIRADEAQWANAPSGSTASIKGPAGNQFQTTQAVVPDPQRLPPRLDYQNGGSTNAFVSRSPEEQAGATEAAKLRAQLDVMPEQQAIETRGAVDRAAGIAQAETQAERSQAAPKRIAQYEEALASAQNVETSIDRALETAGTLSTGFIGAGSRSIAGSPAYNLAAEIETIKANLGFDRLQQMRDNSPTGGALGAIAIQELIALQSTVANLDPNQGEEQLRTNLGRIKENYARWRSTVQQGLSEQRQLAGSASASPAGAARQQAVNPQTGETLELRDGQWVPAR